MMIQYKIEMLKNLFIQREQIDAQIANLISGVEIEETLPAKSPEEKIIKADKVSADRPVRKGRVAKPRKYICKSCDEALFMTAKEALDSTCGSCGGVHFIRQDD